MAFRPTGARLHALLHLPIRVRPHALVAAQTATGTLTLSGINHHTGGTTIAAGTLQLGADHELGSGSLTMSGGTLAFAGFDASLGALTLTADALFDFGSGASALTFADSSALAWSGTLTLFNYTSAVIP